MAKNWNLILCVLGFDQSCGISAAIRPERLAPLSINGTNQGPLKPLEHHGNIVPRGLKGPHYADGVSLSDCHRIKFLSDQVGKMCSFC